MLEFVPETFHDFTLTKNWLDVNCSPMEAAVATPTILRPLTSVSLIVVGLVKMSFISLKYKDQ
jgi:hypothetical protein